MPRAVSDWPCLSGAPMIRDTSKQHRPSRQRDRSTSSTYSSEDMRFFVLAASPPTSLHAGTLFRLPFAAKIKSRLSLAADDSSSECPAQEPAERPVLAPKHQTKHQMAFPTHSAAKETSLGTSVLTRKSSAATADAVIDSMTSFNATFCMGIFKQREEGVSRSAFSFGDNSSGAVVVSERDMHTYSKSPARVECLEELDSHPASAAFARLRRFSPSPAGYPSRRLKKKKAASLCNGARQGQMAPAAAEPNERTAPTASRVRSGPVTTPPISQSCAGRPQWRRNEAAAGPVLPARFAASRHPAKGRGVETCVFPDQVCWAIPD